MAWDALKEASPLEGPEMVSCLILIRKLDNQVPRNIRSASKDAVEKWLLNTGKDMDVRLGMTASILDEIFNDPNLPGHYGPLCLQIQTALEEMLNQVSRS